MKQRSGVTVLRQRHSMDCGVASLAMFFDVPYGEMAAVVIARFGALCPVRRGLGIHHLEELAEFFDRRLTRVYKRKGYLTHATGVLGLVGGSWCGHWVVLKDGVLIDPDDGKVWSVDDYCVRHGDRTATLLIEEKRVRTD